MYLILNYAHGLRELATAKRAIARQKYNLHSVYLNTVNIKKNCSLHGNLQKITSNETTNMCCQGIVH